jgi:hypothetical protein
MKSLSDLSKPVFFFALLVFGFSSSAAHKRVLNDRRGPATPNAATPTKKQHSSRISRMLL